MPLQKLRVVLEHGVDVLGFQCHHTDARAPQANLSDLSHCSSPHFQDSRGGCVFFFRGVPTRLGCLPARLSSSIGLGGIGGKSVSSAGTRSSAERTARKVRRSSPRPLSSRCNVAREIQAISARRAWVKRLETRQAASRSPINGSRASGLVPAEKVGLVFATLSANASDIHQIVVRSDRSHLA